MPKLKVDGLELEVAAGATALQEGEMGGAKIPRSCYEVPCFTADKRDATVSMKAAGE